MRRIVEYDYMSDIDGNRGITAVFYELAAEDSPEIKSQIIEYIEATGEFPDESFTIHLIDPVTEEDIYLEVNPYEYICEEECQTYITEE